MEVGIELEDESEEFIPYGNFIVKEYSDTKSNNQYKIIAYDYMDKLNPEFVDNNTYPITLKEFYTAFADQYHIALEEQTLPNEDFVINEKPFFDGATGRQVLSAIAQMCGSFAKFNRENRLQMYLNTETEEQITIENMNSSLEIDKVYGPINCVMLKLGQVEGENVTLRDDESIATYGETQLVIEDNPFVNSEETRLRAINAIFEQVKGFTYVPTSFQYMAYLYIDCGDKVDIQNMDGETFVRTIILNQDIELPATRQSKCSNPALTETAVKNQFTPAEKIIARQTELKVDKQNQIIQGLVSQIEEYQQKLAELTISIDKIDGTVKQIGGNNKQVNSVGAAGTDSYEQSEEGSILSFTSEYLKTNTQSGRAIAISNNKWFKFKSESFVIGDSYTLSFKYSNTLGNNFFIKLINNSDTILVNNTEEKELEVVEYTFVALTENVELYVSTANGTGTITDYLLQTGDTATTWQPAMGEIQSSSLEIYYNGVRVTSEDTQTITNINNMGFNVTSLNGDIIITVNKDGATLNNATINGVLAQGKWKRYEENINGIDYLLEVKE